MEVSGLCWLSLSSGRMTVPCPFKSQALSTPNLSLPTSASLPQPPLLCPHHILLKRHLSLPASLYSFSLSLSVIVFLISLPVSLCVSLSVTISLCLFLPLSVSESLPSFFLPPNTLFLNKTPNSTCNLCVVYSVSCQCSPFARDTPESLSHWILQEDKLSFSKT